MQRDVRPRRLNGFLPKAQGGMDVSSENSKLEPAIRAYRERVEGTARHGFQEVFVETRSWQQFRHACHTAITEMDIDDLSALFTA